MRSLPVALGLDALILLVTVAVLAATVNRLVKRRLLLTLVLAGASAILTLTVHFAALPAQVTLQAAGFDTLLQALAAINLLVIATINPLRSNKVPEHFPTIVQDAIIVTLFAFVSVIVLREKVFATSAVGAVVIGFALQDTLGNAFSGLAIQIEKPFRVGQWIRVGEFEGCVEEITWRATKLRTKASTFVVVPNNVISKEAILNYSEPVLPTRVFVEVGATYNRPPNEVKAAIREAIRNAPLALAEPKPDVLLFGFDSSSITYRGRFWVEDFARDEVAKDQVRTNIYYTFMRHGIEIPYPIQVEYSRQEDDERPAERVNRFADALRHVAIFSPLGEIERRELAACGEEHLYAAGEVIVRQDEPGDSMFVICKGRVRVLLEPGKTEVAQLDAGGFFGEMSMLTGDPRTATVSAITDCVVMELTVDAFRRFVLEQPGVLSQITEAVETRRRELAATRASASTPAPDAQVSLFDRVRAFLRLD